MPSETLWEDEQLLRHRLILRETPAIIAGLKDYKQGRVRPWAEIKTELGLDKAIKE